MEYKLTGKINQKLIDEIKEINQECGLTAENIIEYAKDKKSELHKHFDWSNKVAGDKWRLHQARVLINQVKVVINGDTMPAFENVEVEISEGNARQYKPVSEILSTEEYRNQMIQRALSNLLYWREQYGHYKEFEKVTAEIDQVKLDLQPV